MTYRIESRKNGKVFMPGVDHGGKMTVVAENQKTNTVVVHIAGHKYWSGRGQQRGYAPAKYHVFAYRSRTETDDYVSYIVNDFNGDVIKFEGKGTK